MVVDSRRQLPLVGRRDRTQQAGEGGAIAARSAEQAVGAGNDDRTLAGQWAVAVGHVVAVICVAIRLFDLVQQPESLDRRDQRSRIAAAESHLGRIEQRGLSQREIVLLDERLRAPPGIEGGKLLVAVAVGVQRCFDVVGLDREIVGCLRDRLLAFGFARDADGFGCVEGNPPGALGRQRRDRLERRFAVE